MIAKAIPLVALVVALGASPVAAAPNAKPASPAKAGSLAGLTLIDAQGGPYTPAAAEAGTVTLVGLWATWCPSCRSELPDLIRLEHELKPKGVRLVLVSVDRTPEKAASYLARMNYTGEAAYDPGARSATRLGIDGIPTVIVLDATGRERERIVGSGKSATARLRAEVAALIAARAEG
jgi:thiol-disulfide isomerase/thioredoxin